jgi:hypothetical protein
MVTKSKTVEATGRETTVRSPMGGGYAVETLALHDSKVARGV